MDDMLEFLKRIENRLATIETLMAKPRINDVVCKEGYSCSEVSELSQTLGIRKYRPYTVRLACSDERVPEATKREDGSWVIPRQAVLRILHDGLPPERRKGITDNLNVRNDSSVIS